MFRGLSARSVTFQRDQLSGGQIDLTNTPTFGLHVYLRVEFYSHFVEQSTFQLGLYRNSTINTKVGLNFCAKRCIWNQKVALSGTFEHANLTPGPRDRICIWGQCDWFFLAERQCKFVCILELGVFLLVGSNNCFLQVLFIIIFDMFKSYEIR